MDPNLERNTGTISGLEEVTDAEGTSNQGVTPIIHEIQMEERALQGQVDLKDLTRKQPIEVSEGTYVRIVSGKNGLGHAKTYVHISLEPFIKKPNRFKEFFHLEEVFQERYYFCPYKTPLDIASTLNLSAVNRRFGLPPRTTHQHDDLSIDYQYPSNFEIEVQDKEDPKSKRKVKLRSYGSCLNAIRSIVHTVDFTEEARRLKEKKYPKE